MPSRRPPLALAVLLLAAGCQAEPWNDSQRAEATRRCRDQFGFPPISVFEPEDVTFVRFMCECEVAWVAARVPHRRFQDRLRLDEVNRILQAGGVSCLQQLKQDRGR